MATFRATRSSAKRPAAAVGWAASTQKAWGTIEIDTLPVALDAYEMLRLPKGAVVLGGTLYGDKLASGTSFGSQNLAWNVGVNVAVVTPDGTTVSTLSTSTAMGNIKPEGAALDLKNDTGYNQAVGGLLVTHGPFRLTDNGLVSLICTSAPTIGSFSTGTISLVVEYAMEQHH